MSKRTTFIVAIETYRDPAIPAFEYAEADAQALATMWPSDEVEILINDAATKTMIESRLRKLNKEREADDSLSVIYFGHAFSFEGENYLSCNDSLSDDLDLTSIPLSGMIERADIDLLFIDGSRHPLADPLDAEQISTTAFLASTAGEVSYVAPLHGQGIWTHHILEALRKPSALSGSELQEHLLAHIPTTLRKAYSDTVTRTQTPTAIGNFDELHLKGDTDGQAAPPSMDQLTHVVMSGEQAGKIKNLSGFNKQWHSIPEEITDKTVALVEQLGAEEVESHAQDLFQRIKAAFKYKRREIECDSGAGCATIRTPDFDVDINIVPDAEDLSGYLIETAACRFKTPSIAETEAFNEVFSNSFKVLRFDFASAFNIEDVIDTIEDLEDDAVQVAYPADCSSCSITTTVLHGQIVFDDRGFRIQLDQGGEPVQLLTAFTHAQSLLGSDNLLPA